MQSLFQLCIEALAKSLPEQITNLPLELQDEILEFVLRRSKNDTLLDTFEILLNDERAKLDLSYSDRVTDDTLSLVSKRCKNLKYLDLSFCSSITHSGLEAIFENCTKLVGLSLHGSQQIHESAYDKMNLAELRYLDIGMCWNVLDSSINSICSSSPRLSW